MLARCECNGFVKEEYFLRKVLTINFQHLASWLKITVSFEKERQIFPNSALYPHNNISIC